jgi:hypothetical protein
MTAAMLDGRNNKIFLHENEFIPQGKEILLFCHSTWLPSRDHAKPLYKAKQNKKLT